MTPLLSDLTSQLTNARETADTSSRALAGEQVAQPMDMGMGGQPGAMPPTPGGDMGDMGAMPPGDEFGATDAAVGGPEELGRERR